MTGKQAAEAFDIDVSPANLEGGKCPWKVHEQLRDRGPVVVQHRPGDQIAYVVTGYDDVVEGLQDQRFSKDTRLVAERFPDIAANAKQSGFLLSTSASRHLLNTDPPDHTRLRRLVTRAFTPRRVEGLRPRIQEIVDQLLDELQESAKPDLIEGFAFQLSITMICELLGVPSADRADFRTWSVASTTPPLSEDTSAQVEASQKLHDYLSNHVATRRKELESVTDPRSIGDVLGAMIVAKESEDALSDSELVGMAFLILVAGHETTVGLIGAMAHGLCVNKDQRQLLIEDPSLIQNAVEEFLRYEGPVQRSTFRVSLEDVEIGGVNIPAGSVVSMMIGSANHDPRQFDDPDRIDITRRVDRHLAFGQGIHFCLGAPLARLEAQLAIGTLVRRFPDFDLAVDPGDLTYQPTVIRAVSAFPVNLGAEATV